MSWVHPKDIFDNNVQPRVRNVLHLTKMSCPSAAEFDGKFLKNVNYETQCPACRQLQIDKVYTDL